jgi:hypothetical protein
MGGKSDRRSDHRSEKNDGRNGARKTDDVYSHHVHGFCPYMNTLHVYCPVKAIYVYFQSDVRPFV